MGLSRNQTPFTMQQLIIKKDVEQTKIDALLYFLKSWDIEAEFKTSTVTEKMETDFSLAVGLWEDYPMDAGELRKQAWNRKKLTLDEQ